MNQPTPPSPPPAPSPGGVPPRPWSALLGGAAAGVEVERRLAALVDASHDLVFLVAVEPGGAFRCIAVNAAYRRATGLATEQVVGRTLDDILPEPARAWARARYEDAIARRVAIHYEEDVALPAGRLLLETTLTPIVDEGGRCTHVFGAARDVTARRDLEERLRQAQKMEAVGRLAGGIAHDFNNLLTAIRCNVQLAADGLPPGDPVRDDVAQIAEAADRAAALTRQLLAFSRRQLLQPVPLDLNRVVHDMERMLRRIVTVQGPHITLDTVLAPDIRPVLADVVQMQQVLLNLAVNARDAMTDGGALLIATANATVRAPDPHRHGVVPPGEYVTLVVRDTGHGMDDATLDRLFEPFFTTKSAGTGTGLGLSTVQGIVEQSGGHLVTHSTPGIGTTFTLYLPVHRVDAPPAAAAAGAPPARTVLVVEPEEAIRTVAARVLRRAGFLVLEAATADAALSLLDSSGAAPDVVLADFATPAAGGRAFADLLRERHPRIRVLYTSGCPDDVARHEGAGAAGDTVLAKPFAPAELEAAMRAVLRDPLPTNE